MWQVPCWCYFLLLQAFRSLTAFCTTHAGTAYTAVYIWVTTGSHGLNSANWTMGPTDMKSFFLGLNIMLSALGGHGNSLCFT